MIYKSLLKIIIKCERTISPSLTLFELCQKYLSLTIYYLFIPVVCSIRQTSNSSESSAAETYSGIFP